MGGTRRKGRIGRPMKAAALGLASLGVAGAMTLAGAQVAWAQGPGGGGPSPCTGASSPPSQTGCAPESLLYYANSSGKPSITPGQSVSVYYLDERPYAAGIVEVIGPGNTVVKSIKPTATVVTNSSILDYSELTAFDRNGGSPAAFGPNNSPRPCPTITNGTAPGPAGVCEDLLTFTIPSSGLKGGDTYTAQITVYDYDGNSDQYAWTFTNPKSPAQTPIGAVGGALLAVAMGGGLVFLQQRRHRNAARRNATMER